MEYAAGVGEKELWRALLDEGPSWGEGATSLSQLRLSPVSSIISSTQEQHNAIWILNTLMNEWENTIDPCEKYIWLLFDCDDKV